MEDIPDKYPGPVDIVVILAKLKLLGDAYTGRFVDDYVKQPQQVQQDTYDELVLAWNINAVINDDWESKKWTT